MKKPSGFNWNMFLDFNPTLKRVFVSRFDIARKRRQEEKLYKFKDQKEKGEEFKTLSDVAIFIVL